jgi:magnesium-transporting ATPase (P-type)
MLIGVAIGLIAYTLSRRVDVDEIRAKTDQMTADEKRAYDEKTVQAYVSWSNKPFLVIIPIALIFSLLGFFQTKSLLSGNSFGISEDIAYLWLVFGGLTVLVMLFNVLFERIRSPAIHHAKRNNRNGWLVIMVVSGIVGVMIYRKKFMNQSVANQNEQQSNS